MLNMSQTIERTALTQLVTNEQYARKVLPFMKKDYFSDRTERTVFEESYIKSGYTKMKLEQIIDILEIHAKNRIPGKGLWFSSNEPYNIGSKIHPNNGPIYAYIDPVLSLLGSFKFDEDNIEYSSGDDKVVSLKGLNTKKMKRGRYLYYVTKEDFIPSEKDSKHKYFTQNPVVVLEKEKILNVYNKLNQLNLIN